MRRVRFMVWAAVVITLLGGAARLAWSKPRRAVVVPGTLSVLPDCERGSLWLSTKECFGRACPGPNEFALLEWSAEHASISFNRGPERSVERARIASVLVEATHLEGLQRGEQGYWAGGTCNGDVVTYRELESFDLRERLGAAEYEDWPEVVLTWCTSRTPRAEKVFAQLIELSR